MNWKVIIIFILMIASFIVSAMFFFNSGFFDLEVGQVTAETVKAFLSELNPILNSNFRIPIGTDASFKM